MLIWKTIFCTKYKRGLGSPENGNYYKKWWKRTNTRVLAASIYSALGRALLVGPRLYLDLASNQPRVREVCAMASQRNRFRHS